MEGHGEQYAFRDRIQEGARPSRSVFARNGTSGSGGEASSEGKTSVDRRGFGSEAHVPVARSTAGSEAFSSRPPILWRRSIGPRRLRAPPSPPRRTWLVGCGKIASAGLEYATASSGLGRFGVGLREALAAFALTGRGPRTLGSRLLVSHGTIPLWRSLGDSNPCLRRERALSWASRRREPGFGARGRSLVRVLGYYSDYSSFSFSFLVESPPSTERHRTAGRTADHPPDGPRSRPGRLPAPGARDSWAS